jgi:flagellar basal-body rod protein FlgB
MPVNSIFDNSIQVLDQVLGLRSRKLQVISSNIANAETPGYSRLRMDFEDALANAAGNGKDAQAATHPAHMQSGPADGLDETEPGVYRQPNPRVIGDGNNVVLEKEMMDLAENQIKYEAAIQMLNKKFNMLKFVIQERA